MIKVFVIDDNLIELSILKNALSSHKIDCRTTNEPLKALAEVLNYQPDLIILDLNMLDISGLDLCKQLKVNPDTSNIPIIFLTADESSETVIRGVHLGIVDYLHKPVTPDELVSAVFAQNTATQLKDLFKPLENKTRELIDKYDRQAINYAAA